MKRKKMNIGILGFGEVGEALSQFYRKERLFIRDRSRNEFKDKLDILNVTIPDSIDFEKIVSQNIELYHPSLVIIHSTIIPGKTNNLFNKYRNVVHSPIRGVHPHLTKGIKTFVKFIGCDNKNLGKRAANHFHKIGIKNVKIITPSSATELGKLLDTTYYGLSIAFHAYAESICKKLRVDFENVMTEFNKTYNEGYTKLGKKNVVRPVLYPPENNQIGGHCIMQNTVILKRSFGDDILLETILRHK